ncbi:MAG: HAMP domain-containing histidine kinase [Zoogloeaceae bacterium]|nr:HAMP domain-containing histidine kinase [Zoogloeaceae bacterium]
MILLLGGAILQSWLLLERLTEQSLASGQQALKLSATLQALDERGVDLERSTRQYLLVRQDAFRAGFNAARDQAQALIQQLLEQREIPELQPLLSEWNDTVRTLSEGLNTNNMPDSLSASTALSRLAELQSQMRQIGQQWVDERNRRMLAELRNQQVQLRLQLLFSFLGAVLVALIMEWWLVRPIRQVESAISRLGNACFADEVRVDGPADMRRLGKRLDWLRQRLGELKRDQESTLRHIAQELNPPLTALQNGVDLLTEDAPETLSASHREAVIILRANFTILQKQVDGLAQMVQQVYDMRGVQRQYVNLCELLSLVAENQGERARALNVKVHVDLRCAENAEVFIDAEKVVAVLNILFDNALNFSPRGKEVTLLAELLPGELRLECHDEGPGVVLEDALHIFEPFYRGRIYPENRVSGSGISLSIARELTRAMGGNIQLLETSPGAHFRVDLPIESAQ